MRLKGRYCKSKAVRGVRRGQKDELVVFRVSECLNSRLCNAIPWEQDATLRWWERILKIRSQ